MSKKYITTGVIFLACFASAFLWPLLAYAVHSITPRAVSNYLFFWPQLSLPYDSVVIREVYSSKLIFTNVIGQTLNIIQWLIIILIFVVTASKIKNKVYLVGLSFAVIVIVPIVVSVIISSIGYSIELDGP